MPEDRVHRSTILLRRMSAGDPTAAEELLPLVYGELRDMARQRLARERPDHTLQPTALVHEVWIKLANQKEMGWESRRHFLRVAATAMRSVLVDHARIHGAQKRGEGRSPVSIDEVAQLAEENADLVLSLDETIRRLAALNEQLGRIAELRCFLGLANREIAEVLDVSIRTVERGWPAARAWLQREMSWLLSDRRADEDPS